MNVCLMVRRVGAGRWGCVALLRGQSVLCKALWKSLVEFILRKEGYVRKLGRRPKPLRWQRLDSSSEPRRAPASLDYQ